MSSRTVVIAAPSSNAAKKVENFTGKTFADLKANSTFSSLYSSGLEVILNPGNVTLTRDDAELPEGDFRVFLVPTKNKSGMTEDSARTVGEQISNAIVKAANLASDNDVTNLKERLIAEIESFFDVDLSDEDCEECAEALVESRRYVQD